MDIVAGVDGPLVDRRQFITSPPTRSVGGRLVMVAGVCRRLSSSVSLAYAT